MTYQKPNPKWPVFLRNFIRDTNLLATIYNAGWIFFDKILRVVIGVLVGAWVARYLGPSQFGELAYCIAFIAIFQSIANLGLDGVAVREISKNNHEASVILGTIFELRLFFGMLLWVLAIIIYGFTNSFYDQGIWIIGFIGVSMVFQAADAVDLWFQGRTQSKRTVLAKSTAYLISNGIKIVFILMQAPLIAFSIVIAVESALTALALFIAYKKFPSEGSWKRINSLSKVLLKESWPYLISGLSIVIYMRIDQLMLKHMLGVFDLGLYSAVIPIASIWSVIPNAIILSIAPYMSKEYLKGSNVFNNKLTLIFRLLWGISIIIN